MGATAMEKTSGDESSSKRVNTNAPTMAAPSACSILDPECDACQ